MLPAAFAATADRYAARLTAADTIDNSGKKAIALLKIATDAAEDEYECSAHGRAS